MAEDLYDEEGRTPSQAAMDQQGQAQAAQAAQQQLGALRMAGQQIVEAVQQGADREVGRELLGRMDALAQGEAIEGEDTAIYAEYQRFIRTHQRGPERAASSAFVYPRALARKTWALTLVSSVWPSVAS